MNKLIKISISPKLPKYLKSLKILIIFIGLLSLFSFPTFAQTKTASSSGKIDTTIQSLKDKIATKVAELRKDQEKLVTGHIEKIDKSTIVINYQEQKLSLSFIVRSGRIFQRYTG
jgi:maltodextrin utilization protein YvdJ